MSSPRGFYEFFSGGGMARAGLGERWRCLFANDFDAKKAASYRANWGGEALLEGDIHELKARDLPARAALAWASFPCQDLSLAGLGAGLEGDRSGCFWPLIRLLRELKKEGRMPPLIALENVCGALSSHAGRDFAAIGAALSSLDCRWGAMVVDAAYFLPQSRPRLFIVAVHSSINIDASLVLDEPSPLFHPKHLVAAHERLSGVARKRWLWWRMPAPDPSLRPAIASLVEDEPVGVRWHSLAQTEHLLSLMTPVHRERVELHRRARARSVGFLFRRTRTDVDGQHRQRAEVRFDGLAGCLRTPAGGSSRQTLLIAGGGRLRSRLLSPREQARLMGLPDAYLLPTRVNEACHLTGDGVVVPAVRHLARHLLEPLLKGAK